MIVLPALRRERTKDLASGWRKTAVSLGRISAAIRLATDKAATSAARRLLIFIGGRRVVAEVRTRHGEEGLDLLRRKLFHAAQRNSFQPQVTDLVAPQPADLIAEGGEELADLALLAVVHVNVELRRGLVGFRIHEVGAFHFEMFTLDHHAAQQLAQSGGGEGFLERNIIALHHEIRRVHQLVREIAVGGKDDETLAVLVETTGGEETELGPLARQQFEDGAIAVRVAVAADDPARFVHHQGDFRLALRTQGATTADRDLVGCRIDLLPDGRGLAVHVDFAGGDQTLGRAARAQAGVGDEFLNANGLHVCGLNWHAAPSGATRFTMAQTVLALPSCRSS